MMKNAAILVTPGMDQRGQLLVCHSNKMGHRDPIEMGSQVLPRLSTKEALGPVCGSGPFERSLKTVLGGHCLWLGVPEAEQSTRAETRLEGQTGCQGRNPRCRATHMGCTSKIAEDKTYRRSIWCWMTGGELMNETKQRETFYTRECATRPFALSTMNHSSHLLFDPSLRRLVSSGQLLHNDTMAPRGTRFVTRQQQARRSRVWHEDREQSARPTRPRCPLSNHLHARRTHAFSPNPQLSSQSGLFFWSQCIGVSPIAHRKNSWHSRLAT